MLRPALSGSFRLFPAHLGCTRRDRFKNARDENALGKAGNGLRARTPWTINSRPLTTEETDKPLRPASRLPSVTIFFSEIAEKSSTRLPAALRSAPRSRAISSEKSRDPSRRPFPDRANEIVDIIAYEPTSRTWARR